LNTPAARETTDPSHAFRINFLWLLRLRWGVIIGQIAFIASVRLFMHVALPLGALDTILGVEIVTNWVCLAWLKRDREVREAHVGLLVALDLVLFSLLLYFTGGPTNPFSFLYLIHIAIAALVLRPRWMWGLVALALLCSGLLFVDHVPLAMDHGAMDHGTMDHSAMHHEHGEHGHEYGMHLRGMWIALAVSASFIVYFLHRVTGELAARERELSVVREETVKHERLAALATLSAGAAHELASPLSTIAVVTRELERRLENGSDAQELADVRLVRQQVERCRNILSQMAADAGGPAGDVARALHPSELIALSLSDLPGADRVDVSIAESAEEQTLLAMPRPLAQALRSLVKNALDASSAKARVGLAVSFADGAFRIEVSDSGTGMTPEVEAHAVEPFFTTKPTGQGMGLGLFLTKSVAEQHGGRLEISTRSGYGTRASLFVPQAPAATICRIPQAPAPAHLQST
jgi:two-component system sensor histidine kinase RegB